MKYVFLILLLIVISIGIPIFILFQIERVRRNKFKIWIKIIITFFSSILLIITFTCTYLGVFYRADSIAYDALKSDEIEALVQSFVRTAQLAEQAGFSGV